MKIIYPSDKTKEPLKFGSTVYHRTRPRTMEERIAISYSYCSNQNDLILTRQIESWKLLIQQHPHPIALFMELEYRT